MFEPRVFIIIPVHNRRETTLGCLGQLQDNGDLAIFQVVVVDDGSTDGTSAVIQERFPQVHILRGDGNLWWAGAIAFGMQYALEQQAEYIFWLNDDCLPQGNCLAKMLEFLQERHMAVVGARCLEKSSQAPIPTGSQKRRALTASPEEVLAVEGLSGYLVGMTANITQRLGLPDAQKFPQYGGDAIYTLQAFRAGIGVYILGGAIALVSGKPANSLRDFYHQQTNKSWRQMFATPKSPYYLRMRYFYYTSKYTLIWGTVIWFTHVVLWQSLWFWWQCKTKLFYIFSVLRINAS
jgi:Predicted glycosyltransferases